jgi:hypothetical protein
MEEGASEIPAGCGDRRMKSEDPVGIPRGVQQSMLCSLQHRPKVLPHKSDAALDSEAKKHVTYGRVRKGHELGQLRHWNVADEM